MESFDCGGMYKVSAKHLCSQGERQIKRKETIKESINGKYYKFHGRREGMKRASRCADETFGNLGQVSD